jgi:colanic acid biosynthesis protein WcaH
MLSEFEKLCIHGENGLPEDIFLLFSRHIPMVNVDLLIRGSQGTLLSWRDDEICGTGWHIPGGIIKYKETIDECIQRVSKRELGTAVVYAKRPIEISELICKQSTRGHFISFLFNCRVPHNYATLDIPSETPGHLQWHEECPDNLIEVQNSYRDII